MDVVCCGRDWRFKENPLVRAEKTKPELPALYVYPHTLIFCVRVCSLLGYMCCYATSSISVFLAMWVSWPDGMQRQLTGIMEHIKPHTRKHAAEK